MAGQLGMELFHPNGPYKSIYDRPLDGGHRPKIYFYDQASSSMEITFLGYRPELFATFSQFLANAKSGSLPDYSFVEPNENDHSLGNDEQEIASDEDPDHHVQEGEIFRSTTPFSRVPRSGGTPFY